MQLARRLLTQADAGALAVTLAGAIARYLAELGRAGLASATILRKLSAACSLFDWCTAAELLAPNPGAGLRTLPRIARNLRGWLEVREATPKRKAGPATAVYAHVAIGRLKRRHPLQRHAIPGGSP